MSKDDKQVEILARGLFVKDGCLLVCRTGKNPLTYLPGGHVEFGEAARESLKREVLEELGCRASVGRFLGAVEHRFVQKGQQHHEINLVFGMTVYGLESGKPVKSAEGHLGFSWLAVSKVRTSDVEPAVLRVLIPSWISNRDPNGWGSTLEYGSQ
jgi:8-oxo-dGTP pyrophosphatase MutT (NUDIX family)